VERPREGEPWRADGAMRGAVGGVQRVRGYGMAVCMRWAGVGVLESNIALHASSDFRCRHAACVIPVKLLALVLALVLAPRPRRPLRSPGLCAPHR
jgi:hypothetical protein